MVGAVSSPPRDAAERLQGLLRRWNSHTLCRYVQEVLLGDANHDDRTRHNDEETSWALKRSSCNRNSAISLSC